MNSEEIILSGSSKRGMNLLTQRLAPDYISTAAAAFSELQRGNVFLATGFYVNGHPETDGPLGIWVIAQTISKLGFTPIIITDRICEGIFEPEDITVEYLDINATGNEMQSLLKRYDPVAMLSAERCGKNQDGKYVNMHGDDISSYTAPVDELFSMCNERILTIGIGDGGNEIGMGNVCAQAEELLHISPCVVPTRHLLIATVSNWACYALCVCLEKKNKCKAFPCMDDIFGFMRRMIQRGCVDGISGKNEPKEDGYGADMTEKIISQLIQEN